MMMKRKVVEYEWIVKSKTSALTLAFDIITRNIWKVNVNSFEFEINWTPVDIRNIWKVNVDS